MHVRANQAINKLRRVLISQPAAAAFALSPVKSHRKYFLDPESNKVRTPPEDPRETGALPVGKSVDFVAAYKFVPASRSDELNEEVRLFEASEKLRVLREARRRK